MNVITHNPVTKRPYGAFQAEVLATLASNPTTPYNPLRALKGAAKTYVGRYLASLRSLETLGLIKEVKGPQGGRYYFVAGEGLLVAQKGGK